MRVTVLYFAGMRDLAGRAEEQMTLPPAVATVEDFVAHLAEILPGFAERRGSVRVARNEAFAEDGEALGDGDVLALIPPVAGG